MKLQILIPHYHETAEEIKPLLDSIALQQNVPFDEIPDEEWKDINGYNGLYQISTYGRVKSYHRRGTKGVYIRPSLSSSGYLQVHLCKNRVSRTFQIHILVALHFIENKDDLPEVNHKDECKTNNAVWNLEFCTRKYNQNYGTAIQRSVKSHDYKTSAIKSAMHHDYKEVARKESKPVVQLDGEDNVIMIWDSVREVSRQLNCSPSLISCACRGINKTALGFRWKFLEASA